MDILLVKSGGRIRAIADVCSHAGGPLHEGDLDLDAGCVTCPWHASVFRLDDGAAVHGPATAPQPAFDVMVDDSGKVSVRAREAG
jgi:nitrite reductase/ring-hydroxylating ferredoxin subunit